MDAEVTIPKPVNLTSAQAATVGVGVLTAFLGVVECLGIPLSELEDVQKKEWVLVFGGASAVGKFAVQILKNMKYKVATTCSAKSFEVGYLRPTFQQASDLVSSS